MVGYLLQFPLTLENMLTLDKKLGGLQKLPRYDGQTISEQHKHACKYAYVK